MIPPAKSNAALTPDILQLPTTATRPRSQAKLLKRVRQLHLYLGIFFAPAILFFSCTGAAQVLNLHETTRGSTYQPPVWLEKLAQLHKKQTLEIRPKAPPKPEALADPQRRPPVPTRNQATSEHFRLGTLLLKWFFFAMSLGLILTTLLGIFMSFQFGRDRRLIWGLLFLGTAVPIVLLFL